MKRAYFVRARLFAVASLGLLIAMPVHAQQPGPFPYKFSMTPEEGPLDPSIEKRYTAPFRACQESAVSTQANEACLAAEFARQDKVLNRTWRATLARLAPQSHKPLVAAQRKWIAARDPYCRSIADGYRGGTIAPVVYTNCRVEQTIRRTMWLEQRRNPSSRP